MSAPDQGQGADVSAPDQGQGADVSAPDRCPGVLRLHPGADGGLARIRLPGGRIGRQGLLAVAAIAQWGNGIVELTSRAALQVRGLPDGSEERCAAALAQGGLLPSRTHERVRNILASPVAGRHPGSLAGTDDLVDELDRAICATPELAGLSGRFLFGVDDGSGLLGEHIPDITLRALSTDRFQLVCSGTATEPDVGRTEAVASAVAAARHLLRAPASPARLRHGPAWRLPVGRLAQFDGRVALTVLPRLGRLHPPLIRALADVAGPTDALRVSPWRTLTLLDIELPAVEPTAAWLRSLGLIDEPESGWHGLSACAGLGACARARFDVRRAAEARAAERAGEDPPEHWAACPRRCGAPRSTHVACTATETTIEREVVGASETTIEREVVGASETTIEREVVGASETTIESEGVSVS